MNYKLGNKWSPDFDYDGMLETGANVTEETPLSDLEKLFDSFEDVNYHTESEPLWTAIVAKKDGHTDYFKKNLAEFKDRCSATIAGIIIWK
jgi:hypothetical protein